MNINIRPAQPRDWLEFWMLRNSNEYLEVAQDKTKHSKKLTEEWFQEALEKQHIYMIEGEEGTLGYCRLVPNYAWLEWVADIIVTDEAKGTGAAGRAIDLLTSSVSDRIVTYISKTNPRGSAFFQRHGFVPERSEGEHMKYYYKR